LRQGLPPALEAVPAFCANRRAVLLENALVRLLPTADLYLRKAGQGYPFDELQNSVLWTSILKFRPSLRWLAGIDSC
jgi:hypothetical protein